MSLPFDATLKELVRRYPLDWLAGLELAAELPVRALDVDLSTVDPPEAALTGLLRRIDERLEAELPPADAQRLLMAAWVLIGMRVPRSKLKIIQEALTMVDLRDSSTYQLIVEEGMAKGMEKGLAKGLAEGLRTMLWQIGSRRLGLSATAVRESLGAIDDVARLRRMGERVLDVATWQEMLATP